MRFDILVKAKIYVFVDALVVSVYYFAYGYEDYSLQMKRHQVEEEIEE